MNNSVTGQILEFLAYIQRKIYQSVTKSFEQYVFYLFQAAD